MSDEFIDISNKKEHKIPLGKINMGLATMYAHEMREAGTKETAASTLVGFNAFYDKYLKSEEDNKKIMLANTSLLATSVADVLYDFDGFALTLEDGTRELKNKAVNSSTPNGKLFSGNPLDFQGSQYVDIGIQSFSQSQKKTVVFSGSNFNNGYILNLDYKYIIRALGNSQVDVASKFNSITIEDNDVIAIVQDTSTTARFLLNGIEQESIIIGSPIPQSLSNCFVGVDIGGSSQFLDGQKNFLAIIDDALSESEIKRFTTEPEKALTDYGTKSELKGVFVTDFSGNGGFISNMCTLNTGEIIPNTGTTISGGIETTITNTDGDNFDMLFVGESGTSTRPIVSASLDLVHNKNYLLNLKVSNIEGIIHLTGIHTGLTINYVHRDLTLGDNFFIFQATGDRDKHHLYFDETQAGEANIEYSLKEIDGVHQIQGYHETQRTNFQAQPKGLQQLLLSKNELGFSDGLANSISDTVNKLETNIQFLKDEDYTFELLIDQSFNINEYIGCSLANPLHRILIGRSSLGMMTVWFGQKSIKWTAISNVLHIFIVKKGNIYTVFSNNTEIGSMELSGLNIDVDFSATRVNGRSDLLAPKVKTFVINKYKKAFVAIEAKTLFKLRQSQYPTLNLGAE